jgi:hypothetical protein
MNAEDYPLKESLPSNKCFAKVVKSCGETVRKLIILRRCRVEEPVLPNNDCRPGGTDIHHGYVACDLDVLREPRPLCQLKVAERVE